MGLHRPAQTGIRLPKMAPEAEDMTRWLRSLKALVATVAITLTMAGQGMAGQVLAQASEGSWFPFKIPGLTTGSVTPAAPLPGAAATPGAPEWSGESGSSGHPLMTAEAIRAAAANFHACLEALWPEAE